ncbi:MAG: Hpt domain-containing protein [Thermodesulfobacteriota bacterium]|nr:Hpt domain-containing protein [Thermodesulfobacteriota bacterium]
MYCLPGFKGGSATVFAWRISNLALELEYLARDGEVKKLSDPLVDLQAAFDELAAWRKKQIELSQELSAVKINVSAKLTTRHPP